MASKYVVSLSYTVEVMAENDDQAVEEACEIFNAAMSDSGVYSANMAEQIIERTDNNGETVVY